MPEIVGYCRVSTDGQTLDAQVAELKAAGATKLFAKKQSGARDRPQLRKALAALGEGDVLMVTRLDRLARSTRDLLNVLHQVAQSSAAFKSLHDHWADATTPHGRLMLTILGGLAEFERSFGPEHHLAPGVPRGGLKWNAPIAPPPQITIRLRTPIPLWELPGQ